MMIMRTKGRDMRRRRMAKSMKRKRKKKIQSLPRKHWNTLSWDNGWKNNFESRWRRKTVLLWPTPVIKRRSSPMISEWLLYNHQFYMWKNAYFLRTTTKVVLFTASTSFNAPLEGYNLLLFLLLNVLSLLWGQWWHCFKVPVWLFDEQYLALSSETWGRQATDATK